MPRVTWYLGRWIRSTDWYPDRAVRLYDRTCARWDDRPVHEALLVDGAVADLAGEIEHRPYANVAAHLARMDHYTTLASAQMHADGRRARAWHLVVHLLAAVLRNYVARAGVRDGVPGLDVAARRRVRAVEVREAVGAAARRILTHADPDHSHRHGTHVARRPTSAAHRQGTSCARPSDDAGGASRWGAAPPGATDAGACRWRRASRSTSTRRGNWPASSARLTPVLHAVDPHGVAVAALALGFRMPWPPPVLVASRRVDFKLAGHALSRAKYRRVDRFVCASAAIGRIPEADGVEPSGS